MGKKPTDNGHGRRVKMAQRDKDALRRNLLLTFATCGASDVQARKALDTGDPTMLEWIQRWICSHTDYDKEGLTEDSYRKGCFAWILYKAAVEVAGKLEVTEATRKHHNDLLRKKVEELDNAEVHDP